MSEDSSAKCYEKKQKTKKVFKNKLVKGIRIFLKNKNKNVIWF